MKGAKPCARGLCGAVLDYRIHHKYSLLPHPKGLSAAPRRKRHEGFMVKITYIDSFGEARTIEAEEGSTVMESAIRNAIPAITAESRAPCPHPPPHTPPHH